MQNLTDPTALTANEQCELAFVYAFTSVFGVQDEPALHPYPAYQPQDLEEALGLDQSDLLDQLLCSFLSNALNRKKPVGMNTMLDTLSKIVHAKIQAGELLLDANPVKQVNSFHELSLSLKLTLLRSLIEWQLQDCQAIRAIIERGCKNRRPKEPNPIRTIDPIGYDGDKRAYYMFGDSPWLWREKSTLKTGCQWETVCRSMEELNAYADTLSKSTSRAEQLLSSIILTYVPFIEQSIREKERKEKALERQRMAQIEAEQLGPRQLRDRRGIRPSYTFDEDLQGSSGSDEEYDQHEDEDTAEGAGEPDFEPEAVPKATRFSSRLNPDAATNSMEEDKQATSQHMDATMGEGTQSSLPMSQVTDRMDTDTPPTMSQADVIMQDAA